MVTESLCWGPGVEGSCSDLTSDGRSRASPLRAHGDWQAGKGHTGLVSSIIHNDRGTRCCTRLLSLFQHGHKCILCRLGGQPPTWPASVPHRGVSKAACSWLVRVARIQFLVTVGRKSPFLCQPAAEGCSQVLEATPRSIFRATGWLGLPPVLNLNHLSALLSTHVLRPGPPDRPISPSQGPCRALGPAGLWMGHRPRGPWGALSRLQVGTEVERKPHCRVSEVPKP